MDRDWQMLGGMYIAVVLMLVMFWLGLREGQDDLKKANETIVQDSVIIESIRWEADSLRVQLDAVRSSCVRIMK